MGTDEEQTQGSTKKQDSKNAKRAELLNSQDHIDIPKREVADFLDHLISINGGTLPEIDEILLDDALLNKRITRLHKRTKEEVEIGEERRNARKTDLERQRIDKEAHEKIKAKKLITAAKAKIDSSDVVLCESALEVYNLIIDVIKTYLDLTENTVKMMTLWIIAASMKNKFITFPILHINAPKGSGKSRAEALLEVLIPNSLKTSNISEAAFFRLPSERKLNALLIDEAEHMKGEEKRSCASCLMAATKRETGSLEPIWKGEQRR